MNSIQAQTTTVHRLAFQTQPQERDEGITGMSIAINAIESGTDIQDCMKVEEIRIAILGGWPSSISELKKDLQPYQSFRGEIASIDGTVKKYRRTIIPAALEDKAPKHLHLNHMGIKKTELPSHQVHLLDQHEC